MLELVGLLLLLGLVLTTATTLPPTCIHTDTTLQCISAGLTNIPVNTSAFHLNLHDNSISQLPNSKPSQNITFLDLSHNLLHNLMPWLSGFLSLQQLNVSYNRLSILSLADLCDLSQLQHLNLANNLITDILDANVTDCNLTNLLTVDISGNRLSQLPEHFLQNLLGVRWLNASRNLLTGLPANWSQSLASLKVLDLSHNLISKLDVEAFSHLHALTDLYLHHNALSVLSPQTFSGMYKLHVLSVSSNPLIHLPAMFLSDCVSLQYLYLSNLTQLYSVHHLAFRGLRDLHVLNLSGCPLLKYFHADTFQDLPSLTALDVSNNALTTVFEATFQNLSTTKIYVQDNPFICDCELSWLYKAITSRSPGFAALQNITCHEPSFLQGLPMAYLDANEFVCTSPLITNYTDTAQYPIGSAAVLDCVTSGSPHPVITWITPSNQVLRYDPAYVHWGDPQPADSNFHALHHWHLDNKYYHKTPPHIYVLHNGSLYIDFVKRTDAGNYTCYAENYLGNDTMLIEVRLNYEVLLKTVAFSVVVGYACAGIFFIVTVLVAILRYVSYECSKEQRQKRKSIYQILESLQNYRSASMDKFRDYKSAKIDQLSAYKTAKVDKLRNYKNLYSSTLVSYTEKMRENYSLSVNRIRENSRQQVENLRENYNMQKGKFKDYRSHQMDKIHENYTNQVMKVREYGAGQVAKLREQYKLQQQHLMKVLEILDIGSCMTVIEAECMRTESMIFDDLDFDLEVQPKQIMARSGLDSDHDVADSSDLASVHSEGSDDKVRQKPPVNRPTQLPIEEKRKRKHKLRRHRRQPSNISTDTSISQGTPELIPVKAEVCKEDTSVDMQVLSSPSAYVTAVDQDSNTEYESAISQHGSLQDISERQDQSPCAPSPLSSISSRSTPTLKPDSHFVVIIKDEDAASLDSTLSIQANHESTV